MSARDDNRKWFIRDATADPACWAARAIAEFGMEGLLDLYDAMEGRSYGVNLTHRPFAGNEELKALVRACRESQSELSGAIWELLWSVIRPESEPKP